MENHIKVLSSGIKYSSLPEKYVRPESERPRLSEIPDCRNVPVIDLSNPDKSSIISQIRDACEAFGFFQVVNHGVSKATVEAMVAIAEEYFFRLPVEEKMKLYSEDPSKTMRLSTSFDVRKEQVHNWRDYLRLYCWPLLQYVPGAGWPSVPTSFEKTVCNYCKELKSLGMFLQKAIPDNQEKKFIAEVLGEQGQRMVINFYPTCSREPELTYGCPDDHTHPNVLTIVQASQVTGLPVLIDGRWLSVDKSHPDAFVINISHPLQQTMNNVLKKRKLELLGQSILQEELERLGQTILQHHEEAKRIKLQDHEMLVGVEAAMAELGKKLSVIEAQVSAIDAHVQARNIPFQQREMSQWKSIFANHGYAEAFAKAITGCQALVAGGDGPDPAGGSAPNA